MIMNLFPSLSLRQLAQVIPFSIDMAEHFTRGDEFSEAKTLGAQACALLVALLDSQMVEIKKVWKSNYSIVPHLWGNLQHHEPDMVCWALVAIERVFKHSQKLTLQENAFDTRPLVSLLDHNDEFIRYWAFKAIIRVTEFLNKDFFSLHEDYEIVFMQIFRNLSTFQNLEIILDYCNCMCDFIDTLNSQELEKLEDVIIQSTFRTTEVTYSQNLKAVDANNSTTVQPIMRMLKKLKEKARGSIVRIYYEEKRVFKE